MFFKIALFILILLFPNISLSQENCVKENVCSLSDLIRLSVKEAIGNPEFSPSYRPQLFALVPGEKQEWIKQSDDLVNYANVIDNNYSIILKPISNTMFDPTTANMFMSGLNAAYDNVENKVYIKNIMYRPSDLIIGSLVHEIVHSRQRSDPFFKMFCIKFGCDYENMIARPNKNKYIEGQYQYLFNPFEISARYVAKSIVPNIDNNQEFNWNEYKINKDDLNRLKTSSQYLVYLLRKN